ncbi:hypothetical protein [Clostridium estertheticum]|uniref:hypothetical protein n=1 Tax=Clostridium estertheticum TaxID=238834 RepID=UPI00209A7454|nr:hypothetical protein [Clostridium estertheticum]
MMNSMDQEGIFIRILDDPAGWFPTIKYWDDRTNSYLFYKSTTGHELKCKFTIGNKVELRYLYTDKGVDIRANKSFEFSIDDFKSSISLTPSETPVVLIN